jgi:hypothetical protein
MAREMMAVAPCYAWSLLMCQSPLGAGRQKQKYDTLWLHTFRKEHVINPLRFPAVDICYTILEVNVSEFSPAGELDLATHTCGVEFDLRNTAHVP